MLNGYKYEKCDKERKFRLHLKIWFEHLGRRWTDKSGWNNYLLILEIRLSTYEIISNNQKQSEIILLKTSTQITKPFSELSINFDCIPSILILLQFFVIFHNLFWFKGFETISRVYKYFHITCSKKQLEISCTTLLYQLFTHIFNRIKIIWSVITVTTLNIAEF